MNERTVFPLRPVSYCPHCKEVALILDVSFVWEARNQTLNGLKAYCRTCGNPVYVSSKLGSFSARLINLILDPQASRSELMELRESLIRLKNRNANIEQEIAEAERGAKKRTLLFLRELNNYQGAIALFGIIAGAIVAIGLHLSGDSLEASRHLSALQTSVPEITEESPYPVPKKGEAYNSKKDDIPIPRPVTIAQKKLDREVSSYSPNRKERRRSKALKRKR